MRNLERRLTALEGSTEWLSLGEVLDRLDAPVDDGRRPHPLLVAALNELPE